MRKRLLPLLFISILVLSANGFALNNSDADSSPIRMDEVVVTAAKIEVNQSETGSSTTVITEEEIKKSGKSDVLSVLQEVPGVSIMQNGSFGGAASVFIRGAKTGYTLVLIDGIEVNDTIGAGRDFDFAHMLTDNIERIEIVRGAQSTLYGSDAIGGVINIITKKGEGDLKIEASVEGGSYNTFKETLGLSGSGEKADYSINITRLDSDGISKLKDGVEDDGYENTTFSTRLGYILTENIDADFSFRYVDAKYDYDDFYSGYDDPNKESWWKNTAGKLSLDHTVNETWDHKISLYYSETKREYKDSPDAVETFDNEHNWFNGESKKIEWQNNFYFTDWSTTTAGFEYEEESGYTDGIMEWDYFAPQKLDNKGYYLQNQFELNNVLFITLGLRLDDNERFGNETTYKISGSYLITSTGTRLKTNWGTGFKAPSLYQLYVPFYGDLTLEPDEGKTFDFGIEQSFLNDRLMASATYFNNRYKNMIDFDMDTFRYMNVSNAETEGIELALTYIMNNALSFAGNYSYTSTEDKDTGLELARRPKNQISFKTNWLYSENGNVNLSVNYIGNRWNDTGNIVKMKSYTTVDVSSYYDFNKNLKFFGRIENLFDKDYEQISGYTTPGISAYGGIKLTF